MKVPMAHERPDEDYLRVMNSIRLEEAEDLCKRSQTLRARSRQLIQACRQTRRRAEERLLRSEMTMSILTDGFEDRRRSET